MAHGVSAVKIGNMALSHVGAFSSIESLTEDGVEANQINLWYSYSREMALEASDWSFARKRLTLALHGDDAPETDWTYRYQYPVDCLTFRRIVNPAGKENDASPFELEASEDGLSRTIVTDIEDAVGVYTFDQQLPAMFSSMFVSVLSYLLAHHIAFALTGSSVIKDDMLKMYVPLLNIAAAQNANEQMSPPPREAESIRGR